ncbi:hypothetical protein H2200_005651 [Cladophialophora chaetospira]|uniref:RING-type domain-containing protein n=1 Tax=Cladophialophora chaetospira TaxID=386627 RepID=A0AA39CJ45_9EURO|nr:hypothetical protein H2200_005651 [Cladophialophora chaetospira]
MIKCKDILRTIEYNARLLRLADTRQPIPVQESREFGDFGDNAINEVFQHELRVLSLIHRETLVDRDVGIWDYLDLCHTMRADPQRFIEDERERLRHGQRRLRADFGWFLSFGQSLNQARELMIGAYRVAGGEIGDERQAMALLDNTYRRIPPMTKLLIQLLCAEENFEEKLAEDHIWDIKIAKRVRILHPEEASQMTIQAAYRATTINMTELHWRFKRYSLRMRDLYAHRYLVDWRRKRLWNKLYLVIGETGADGVDTGTVENFLQWSTGSQLASVMFGVHPVHVTQLDPEKVCAICQQAPKLKELLMELKGCGHRLHAACLLGYWDQYYYYIHDCPLCRHLTPRLQERFPGFISMAEDIDICYGTDVDAPEIAQNRDHLIRHRQRRGLSPRVWTDGLPEHFWERERIAWLEGTTLKDRLATFPQARALGESDSDSGSSNGECDFEQHDPLNPGSDDNSNDEQDNGSEDGSGASDDNWPEGVMDAAFDPSNDISTVPDPGDLLR